MSDNLTELAIATPNYDMQDREPGLTDDEWAEKYFFDRTIPRVNPDDPKSKKINHKIVPHDYVPEDWQFRDAFTDNGSGVVVDMEKARSIHMDRIRQARNTKLAELDVPFMRAVESGHQTAIEMVSAQKQILRDLPQTFDIVTGVLTPGQLSAKWPFELDQRES
tara:strand:+ start:2573 stop:3064 length:492 start_codon:yes stop_codon:yes gene_type:complete